MDILRTEFQKIGLAINPAKCKLFGPAAVAASSSLFDGIPREPLAECSVFLGVPVGSDQFVEDFIIDFVAKLQRCMRFHLLPEKIL